MYYVSHIDEQCCSVLYHIPQRRSESLKQLSLNIFSHAIHLPPDSVIHKWDFGDHSDCSLSQPLAADVYGGRSNLFLSYGRWLPGPTMRLATRYDAQSGATLTVEVAFTICCLLACSLFFRSKYSTGLSFSAGCLDFRCWVLMASFPHLKESAHSLHTVWPTSSSCGSGLPGYSCSAVATTPLFVDVFPMQEPAAPRGGPGGETVGQVLREDLPGRGPAEDEHEHHSKRQEGLHWGDQRPGGPLRSSAVCWPEGIGHHNLFSF